MVVVVLTVPRDPPLLSPSGRFRNSFVNMLKLFELSADDDDCFRLLDDPDTTLTLSKSDTSQWTVAVFESEKERNK